LTPRAALLVASSECERANTEHVRKRRHGIVVPGGVITTQPRKQRSKIDLWFRAVKNAFFFYPVYWAFGPVDILVWNTERTEVLYREGPIGTIVLNDVLQEFIDGIDQYGIELFLMRRRSSG
jgi:hypothetical protein